MKILECELIEGCLAIKKNGNSVKKKAYNVGDIVQGTITNIALTPDSHVAALKTKEGYIIPEPFLNVIREIPLESNKKSNSKKESVEYADFEEIEVEKKDNIFQDIKSVDLFSGNSDRSKLVVNFAIGGLVVGLVFAMLKKKNKLIYSTVGAFGGGIIGNYVNEKMKENEIK